MKKKLLCMAMAVSIMSTMGATVFASDNVKNVSDNMEVVSIENNLDLEQVQEQMNDVIDLSLGEVIGQEFSIEEDGGYSISTTYSQENTSNERAAIYKPQTAEKVFYDAGGSRLFNIYITGYFLYDEAENTCYVMGESVNLPSSSGFSFNSRVTTMNNGGFFTKWSTVTHNFKSVNAYGVTVNRTAELKFYSNGSYNMYKL